MIGGFIFKANYWFSLITGPTSWKNMQGNSVCGGSKQSPIAIQKSKTKHFPWGPLKLRNYDKLPRSMELHNNGHTG